MDNIHNNQESKNPLLICKGFLNPKLIAEYCRQGLIGGSEAIRLYIAASIISHTRDGKRYYESTVSIAEKLHVSPELVRQSTSKARQSKIRRAGRNGQRGGRSWILTGINDSQENIQR